MKKILILVLISGLAANSFGYGWTRVGGMSLTYDWHVAPTPPGPYTWLWSGDNGDGTTTYGIHRFLRYGGISYGKLEVSNTVDSNDAYIQQTMVLASAIDPCENPQGWLGQQFLYWSEPQNGTTALWVEFIYNIGAEAEKQRYQAAASGPWQTTYWFVSPQTVASVTDITIRFGLVRDAGADPCESRSLLIEDAVLWGMNLNPNTQIWDNFYFDLKPDWRENLFFIQLPENPLFTTESGTTTTYTIDGHDEYWGNFWPPEYDVTCTITPNNELGINGYGAGVPVNLTFTPADYNAPQTVTVAAIDDGPGQGPHTGTITHSFSSEDEDYNEAILGPLTVQIDNDNKMIVVTVVDPPLDVDEEGETTDTYTIKLANVEPTGTVTITATRSTDDITLDVGGGASASVALNFTAANYTTPQTITVKAVNDAFSEGPELVAITHVVSGDDTGYNALTVEDVNVLVADNEEYCGEEGQYYLDADVAGPGGIGLAYRDCYVDGYDLAGMVSQWLDCTDRFLDDCLQW